MSERARCFQDLESVAYLLLLSCKIQCHSKSTHLTALLLWHVKVIDFSPSFAEVNLIARVLPHLTALLYYPICARSKSMLFKLCLFSYPLYFALILPFLPCS